MVICRRLLHGSIGRDAFRSTTSFTIRCRLEDLPRSIRGKASRLLHVVEAFDYEAAKIRATWDENGAYSVLDFPLMKAIAAVFEGEGGDFSKAAMRWSLGGRIAIRTSSRNFYETTTCATENSAKANLAHNSLFTRAHSGPYYVRKPASCADASSIPAIALLCFERIAGGYRIVHAKLRARECAPNQCAAARLHLELELSAIAPRSIGSISTMLGADRAVCSTRATPPRRSRSALPAAGPLAQLSLRDVASRSRRRSPVCRRPHVRQCAAGRACHVPDLRARLDH